MDWKTLMALDRQSIRYKEVKSNFLINKGENMNLKKLCLNLAMTEDGNEVVKILKQNNLWDNEKEWQLVGFHDDKNSNNASIINNQQSNAANALVEKLINCGDSALMLKCREMGIDPKSKDAPRNVSEAIEKLFDIEYGKWNNASSQTRNSLGTEFCNLVVTGMAGRGKDVCPTYTVIDKAEGQAPEKFKDTFLSLTRSNKLEIPFVQGKFGMGSHGAVNFCNVHGLQLIISKRNPKIQDGLSEDWGFTVIRKIEPNGEYKSSRWMYMTINQDIPSFKADKLKIAPGTYPNAYGDVFEFGTFVKMYNYEIGSGLRTHAHLDLNYKLNTLLVNPVIPVRIYERREYDHKPKSPEVTLDGLETRLERDREGVIADGFPADFQINAENQSIRGRIFVFNQFNKNGNKVEPKSYGNGVLFCLNGQANGNLGARFFHQGQKLKYHNIAKNILVMLDCSQLENKYIEKVFKPDRERIDENSFTKEIKDELIEVLAHHQGLKDFQVEWRKQQILKEKENDQKISEMMSKLVITNPALANLLNLGVKITNPFDRGDREREIFKSSNYPNFFRLSKEYSKDHPRNAEKGRNVRINFETDAPNDYFYRSKDPGEIAIFYDNEEITHKSGVKISGFNGKWILDLPERYEDLQKYSYKVTDVTRILEPFEGNFYLKLINKIEKKQGKNKPKTTSNSLAMPEPDIIKRENFESVGFDGQDALMVEQDMSGTYYKLNVENVHLLNYCKKVKNEEIEAVKYQYKVSMMLIGMMLAQEYEKKESEDRQDLSEFSKRYTKTIAPLLLPMIREVGSTFNY